ncbi:RNA polymerase sigma factor [Pseudoxanthomonas sacheonensis]|uniref:RNA polymerase sigma-70 factor (ECF subfamily) n=1 Tax=Pseudoxanthomonas sacheonensis TaxID=443615 RepID=A0ABU1RMH0_9GAMM|nr:sigma-70 family RNA polymerase sigma factor [Pseudoxanthomonas sacheonensis]MDR6839968.1 RNA polymerase sigma-70 factor (ECF subfamily) [Pseudoxanthomonas sacheonensis]
MPSASEANPEEAKLVRKARWGDHDAFAQLYRMHAKAIHALAYRLTGNAAAAEDITQDTFLKMLGFLSGLRGDAPLRPWLKRVAANAAIDRLRREQRFVAETDHDAWPDDSTDPTEDMEILGLLQRLPPLARTVVWLHEMEGWSHPELGERFGRSPSWSKSIVSRALTRLRDDLETGITDD